MLAHFLNQGGVYYVNHQMAEWFAGTINTKDILTAVNYEKKMIDENKSAMKQIKEKFESKLPAKLK